MLFVRDVEESSTWYQDLLGLKGGHGGNEYELITDDEGNRLLQLHHFDGEEHGDMGLENNGSLGAGVLIYVQVEDARTIYFRALEMKADVRLQPTYIRLAYHTELIVRDPDGYRLAIFTRGRL